MKKLRLAIVIASIALMQTIGLHQSFALGCKADDYGVGFTDKIGGWETSGVGEYLVGATGVEPMEKVTPMTQLYSDCQQCPTMESMDCSLDWWYSIVKAGANMLASGDPVTSVLWFLLEGANLSYYKDFFHNACIGHDRCYRRGYQSYDYDRLTCDQDFYWDMVDLCEEIDENNPWYAFFEDLGEEIRKENCVRTAAAFFSGVRVGGSKKFNYDGGRFCFWDGAPPKDIDDEYTELTEEVYHEVMAPLYSVALDILTY